MRHGFRWIAGLLLLALMLPASAGALPVRGAGFGISGWNPWSRLLAFVSVFFGADRNAQKPPTGDTGCGIDPNNSPKCDS